MANTKNIRRYYYQIPINIVLLAFSIACTLLVQRYEQSIGGGISRPLLFVLINLEIFIAILLATSIIRQSITLFIDRYENKPGSGLRKNLLFSFIFLSILPGVFIFLGASKLVIKHLELWFGTRIEQGLSNSLLAYQQTTQAIREEIQSTGKQLADSFSSEKMQYPFDQKSFQVAWWPKKKKSFNLGSEIAQWRSFRLLNDRPTKELKQQLLKMFRAQANSDHEGIIDFYGSIYWLKEYPQGILAVIHRAEPTLRNILIKIQNAHSDYTNIRNLRGLLKFNFYLQSILLLILVLALAIWCAFQITHSISDPIQKLLEATHTIQQGSFLTHIKPSGSQDLQTLTNSFNEMVSSLKRAQESIENKNNELIQVFENLSVSVFLYSHTGRLIQSNKAAQNLYKELTHNQLEPMGRFNNLPAAVKNCLQKILTNLQLNGQAQADEVNFYSNNQHFILKLHLQKLYTNSPTSFPLFLLVIEDLSSVVKINTLKTWQEAVKQIAHEIKNPLTPIQLTTQRLQRKCTPQLPIETQTIFNDGCNMILNQVDVIKNLVATFSSFAISSEIKKAECDLLLIFDEVIKMFQLSYADITFIKEYKGIIQKAFLDSEKIKRALINLILNSIEAIKTTENNNPLVVVQLEYTKDDDFSIIIKDNGPGISPAIQEKLFLPYISTNKKNMGLGLAIVHEIITKHDGKIQVSSSSTGATFHITLPTY